MALSVCNKNHNKGGGPRKSCLRACVCCILVPLTKGGTTVGTPSLTQRQAEEDTEREEDDGTQDPQAGEVVLQHAHPAGWTAPHHHHRGLNDGVGARVAGLLGYSRTHLGGGWGVPLTVGILIRRRRGLEARGWRADRPIIVLLRLLTIFIRPWDGIVGRRSVGKKRFVHLRRVACSS